MELYKIFVYIILIGFPIVSIFIAHKFYRNNNTEGAVFAISSGVMIYIAIIAIFSGDL